MSQISVTVELSIEKPAQEVFEAAPRPVPFFLKRASGPIGEGADITWEFEELAKPFSIRAGKVRADELIQFQWPRGGGGEMNSVEFTLTPFNDRITTLCITESGRPDDAQWREASYRNCMGRMHMACSLKAYLECSVNLRKGSFVQMKFE
jgi:uncharacterized protein YndB with AHSA1/START domain